jgi:uncharacterized protein
MATIPSNEQSRRIVTLDIVRGVAVMGILAMNMVAFSMPMPAYVNPLAYGTQSAADLVAYGFNFIFVDGKMRGLFSFLFGASMLLVIQLAERKGEPPRKLHFRRLLWLLLFGMMHYYLVWFGDILIGYALVGMIAWLFRKKAARSLVGWGVGLLIFQFLLMACLSFAMVALSQLISVPNPNPEHVAMWQEFTREIAVPTPTALAADLALHRGSWLGLVEHQLGPTRLIMPLFFTMFMGWETLAYMLFGMAALKSGFLTGELPDARYRRIALISLAIAVPAYGLFLSRLFEENFSVVALNIWGVAATVPFRPLMILAYAAIIILATRRGGWLVNRIAAAGRAAFTNYLGTSILMTGLFYGWGFGLYGSLSRAQLWIPTILMWLVMLAWSKPWLDRFAYGPFEWLWRSLARWQVQPMRKKPRAVAAVEV